MQAHMDDSEASRLRSLAANISNAVEARIRGEDPFGQSILAAVRKMQIEGVGVHSYWSAQIAQPTVSACLVMAEEIGIFRFINDQAGPVDAATIARETGYDALLIARIMRPLLAVGYGDEVGPNTYQANELSKATCGQIGRASVKVNNELFFKVAGQIVPYMREHGFKQFPQSHEKSLSQYTFSGRSFYDYLKQDPEMKGWFDTMLTQISSYMLPWYKIYPLAETVTGSQPGTQDVLVVDVGGGQGSDALAFRQAHPDLPGRIIVQDLPETVAGAEDTSSKGVDLQAYDFFTRQPVKGARTYLFKWILHNWSDDSIKSFLSNTVQAMAVDSTLLIQELVMPSTGVDFATSTLDIYQLLYFCGVERTAEQWHSLLGDCGLEVAKIWGHEYTMLKILECKRKEQPAS